MKNERYRNLSIEELKEKREIIYRDDVVKISYIDNNSDSVVIAFAYGIKPPHEPQENFYLYTLNDKNIIHVVDLQVSWFNNFEATLILEKIKDLIHNKKVYLTGISMGAFNAVHFSRYIKVERCVAFSPQMYVKRLKPEMYDSAIKFLFERMKSFTLDTATYSKDNEYYIIFGSDEQEKDQSYDTIKHCKENNINAFFTIFNDSPHLVLNYLNETDGPVSKVTENFLHKSKEEIKNIYSHHSAHFFSADENYIYN